MVCGGAPFDKDRRALLVAERLAVGAAGELKFEIAGLVPHGAAVGVGLEKARQIGIERLGHRLVDRGERQRAESPAVLEQVIADQAEAGLVQPAHFAAEPLIFVRLAIDGEQPIEAPARRRLRSEIDQPARAPGIEQRQQHLLDPCDCGRVIGAKRLAADRAFAAIVALRGVRAQLGGEK